jgi:2-polyprenyl-3-methyl-5-hydroxy-6-metoxy-1,4-benzoquinol methylase
MRCPYCNSENIKVHFDANIPNILSACHEESLYKTRLEPFKAMICKECLLGFSKKIISNNEQKEIYDNYYYNYTPTKVERAKYKGILDIIKNHFKKSDAIVEVGCSDGYLLEELRNNEYLNLTGIDVGHQANIAENKGFKIIKDYFNEKLLVEKYDGFLLRHVLEHFPNPFKSLKIMKKLLKPEGKIIIEVPNFCGYHHQHLFFFNIHFFMKFCRENELKIIDYSIEKDSLRLVIALESNTIHNEINLITNKDEYIENVEKYSQNFKLCINEINKYISESKNNIVCWCGTGSTSVIYLNQIDKSNLNNKSIVVIDAHSNKEGLFIPVIGLEINSLKSQANKTFDNMIIASSFYDHIISKMSELDIKCDNIKKFKLPI